MLVLVCVFGVSRGGLVSCWDAFLHPRLTELMKVNRNRMDPNGRCRYYQTFAGVVDTQAKLRLLLHV